MNSKKLIIAFMTVSVAALIVSALAVFTAARTYSRRLSPTADTAEAPSPETSEIDTTTEALPTINDHPETEISTEPETSEEAPETSIPEETSAEPKGYTLSLSEGRLIITSPAGEKAYERIINEKDIREADKRSLLKGIEFGDLEGAMSAVYDIIS